MDQRAPWRALEDGSSVEADVGSAGGIPRSVFLAAGALILAVAAVVAGAVVVVASMPANGLVAEQSGPSDSRVPAASGGRIVVEVTGAVTHPGVYRLESGSRIADAIDAAGGYRSDVDAAAADASLNLASKLVDGQLIRVPKRGDPTASRVPSGSEPAGALDLNSASTQQLDTLPGIGPATAEKIVASREEKPFASVDELVTRKLVTAATLAKFRDKVVVR